MSFFNKMLASVGIGSAKVDTKLEKDTVMPGGEVRGVVVVQGGSTEQQISDIYMSVNTSYLKEIDDKKISVPGRVDQFRLSESFNIHANERKEIPFSFILPLDTPITIGRSRVWIKTDLDITSAVDPSDKDFVRVVPNPLLESVLTAASSLGFRMREADCEQAPRYMRKRLPFVQEFEFVPTSGSFRGRLDELEIVFLPISENQAELLLQVDCKVRGLGSLFSEAMGMDESKLRLTVSSSDIPNMAQKLQSTISRYV
ncbi:sporulation protein [Chungangia koreensis]|uniref:Sporulation protein n=1 Tax=Chungangia koreensis TaxID=752657 RepID=A0ABV8X062_9LACT